MADETGFTAAGSFLQIGTVMPATRDEAGFIAAGVTTGLKEVGEMDDLGEISVETQVNSRVDLKSGLTRKVAGSSNSNAFTITGAMIRGDEGQELAETARRARTPVVFCRNYADGGKEYGVGIVTNTTRSIGDANSFTGFSITIDPDGETVTVDPV